MGRARLPVAEACQGAFRVGRFWFVLQLFNGLLSFGLAASGGVAWFAHIGGFLTGMVLGPLLRRRERLWS